MQPTTTEAKFNRLKSRMTRELAHAREDIMSALGNLGFNMAKHTELGEEEHGHPETSLVHATELLKRIVEVSIPLEEIMDALDRVLADVDCALEDVKLLARVVPTAQVGEAVTG